MNAAAGTQLPVLTATTGVVFPDMVVTFRLESDASRQAVDNAGTGGELLIVPQVGDHASSVGTVVRVEQTSRLPDGVTAAVVRGLRRVHVGRGVVGNGPGLWVEVSDVDGDHGIGTAGTEELAREYRALATRLLELSGGAALAGALREVASDSALADTIGWWPELSLARKVELLETVDVAARLELAIEWARELLAEIEIMSDIRSGVSEELEKTQREAILRRQLDAIRSELGDSDGDAAGEYRRKIAERDLPEAVVEAVTKEIERLERGGDQGTEAGWIRTWLDHVFDIPWGERTDDTLDLDAAGTVLDDDHTGLTDVKDRILEFLAVRKLRAERDAGAGQGSILLLVGPPGVGKTSLGESVARALGRNFVRMALGGIHDEAEIRGHRRTYVGARPGRIVRALADAGSMNPVVLLDEVDKVGSDWRGDPSSALLEVLDPEQNHTFRDHYLEMEIDLSDVFFIATANVAEQIPGPLLDRMEVIALRGYSADEKWEIARDHLLPRLRERNSVGDDEVVLSEELVRAVIDDYTRESGVRRLEQRLDRLIRRGARKIAEGATPPVSVPADELRDVLGSPAPRDLPAERITGPGIAAGLAVSGAGGDVLFVEAVATDGEAGLSLTGQLGDVMRESGEIALAYLRSRADQLDVDVADRRFHVHFPAGATPKDGPSAGITMATALASLLLDRTVRTDVAMTGEITLHGRVLPIGGVKEKVLAAHRAGVTTVILPEANRHDAEDIPDAVRDAVELHFVTEIGDVLDLALTDGPGDTVS